jgi:hypothetical protein
MFDYRAHHPRGEGGTVTTIGGQLDTGELEDRVKAMYREVAETPGQELHFETGRPLAERLGYAPAALDRIPGEAIESFAGVGYFHDLAAIRPGEAVLDLGSGAGMGSSSRQCGRTPATGSCPSAPPTRRASTA